MRAAWEAIRAWWWRLWTGEPSLAAKRRALEEEVRRFDGRVTWNN
jgi:hypothetical protein